MPIRETSRKQYSDVFTNTNANKLHRHGNQSEELAVVTEAATKEEIMGLPVVWDDANATFVPYVAQDIAVLSAGDDNSTLPDGSAVALVCGTARGLPATEDTDLTGGVALQVKYTACEVIKDCIEWDAATTAAQQDVFVKALAKQGIMIAEAADQVTPTYK